MIRKHCDSRRRTSGRLVTRKNSEEEKLEKIREQENVRRRKLFHQKSKIIRPNDIIVNKIWNKVHFNRDDVNECVIKQEIKDECSDNNEQESKFMDVNNYVNIGTEIDNIVPVKSEICIKVEDGLEQIINDNIEMGNLTGQGTQLVDNQTQQPETKLQHTPNNWKAIVRGYRDKISNLQEILKQCQKENEVLRKRVLVSELKRNSRHDEIPVDYQNGFNSDVSERKRTSKFYKSYPVIENNNMRICGKCKVIFATLSSFESDDQALKQRGDTKNVKGRRKLIKKKVEIIHQSGLPANARKNVNFDLCDGHRRGTGTRQVSLHPKFDRQEYSNNKSIFVGRLPNNVNYHIIHKRLSWFGKIKKVFMFQCRTGKRKDAYIRYNNELNNFHIHEIRKFVKSWFGHTCVVQRKENMKPNMEWRRKNNGEG